MAAIQYWFQGLKEIPAGYAGRFQSKNTQFPNQRGPNGVAKGLLAAPMVDCIPQYDKKSQRWDEVEDGVWIGVEKNLSPALFLHKDRGFVGSPVKLGDGQVWTIPVANPISTCTLPLNNVKKQGEWTIEVKEQYKDLADRAFDLCCRCRRAFLENEDLDVPDEFLMSLIGDSIALNYDLTLDELSVLRVFSPETWWPAIHALIDWPAVQEMVVMDVQAQKRGDPVPL